MPLGPISKVFHIDESIGLSYELVSRIFIDLQLLMKSAARFEKTKATGFI